MGEIYFILVEFLNAINVFSLFCTYLNLKESVAVHLKKKTLKSPHLLMLCDKFGLDRHTDKRTKDDQKSSFELSTL